MMPTIEEALEHLGYDEVDDVITRDVTRDLAAAKQVLLGAVGADVEEYLPNDPRTKELALLYLDDIHDERGTSAKVSGSIRRIVDTMETQLRLELRRAKEEAGANG